VILANIVSKCPFESASVPGRDAFIDKAIPSVSTRVSTGAPGTPPSTVNLVFSIRDLIKSALAQIIFNCFSKTGKYARIKSFM
jgi:hypothetical protein